MFPDSYQNLSANVGQIGNLPCQAQPGTRIRVTAISRGPVTGSRDASAWHCRKGMYCIQRVKHMAKKQSWSNLHWPIKRITRQVDVTATSRDLVRATLPVSSAPYNDSRALTGQLKTCIWHGSRTPGVVSAK